MEDTEHPSADAVTEKINHKPMSDGQSKMQMNEAERFDRDLTYPWWILFSTAPGLIAVAAGIGMVAIGAGTHAMPYLLMGACLILLSTALDRLRKSIIRQDGTIRQLQEQLSKQTSARQQGGI